MGEKQMTKHDGINTLANIANAAYQRKTAKALEDANLNAKRQTQLMEERNRQQRAELARQARDAKAFADEQNRLLKEGNRQKAALLQKEHAEKRAHRQKMEEMKRKELQRKEEIARREQSSRNKKSLLFEIHNDVKKSLDNSSYSTLDKYINLCAAVDNIKANKIDHSITDDFAEKDVIQKMIDEVNNNFKSVYDSFSDQDQEDHDSLLKILETDEEKKISHEEYLITRDKDEIVKAETKIQEMIDRGIDDTYNLSIHKINIEIDKQEEENNMLEDVKEKLKERKAELLNLPLSEITSKFYNLKEKNVGKDLAVYLNPKETKNSIESAKASLLKDIVFVLFGDILSPR